MMRKTLTAAIAGLALLTAPAAAFASDSATSTTSMSATSTKPLHLRKGLTLTIPKSWKVYEQYKDWLRVVTGKCASLGTELFGFRDSGCHSFWVMGPKAIKVGHEFFNAYTPDGPFYPATDVGPCPYDEHLYMGQSKLAAKGLRQIGPGHKAYYRKWAGTCVTQTTFKVKGHYNQREWFLPTSKILVIDQWDTPGLTSILKNATWS
ncbi:hypothetical protein N5079_34270 [Planotetraspora sp. A-T 1434]|uniref:hypothetical protein n=1 Tax=Planotetraspora sp. A-T 1434 TaxID=2979219 RepID=UPI0021BEE014|nr:hypothetical protein [Planotetraspora sp. A-T 1434]MCT9935281.1 hypothetical protein [Planotetraspora sp. A-T 1434]